jgi:7-cyano-7-deazaguanine synthase in queuosine biosynthesis
MAKDSIGPKIGASELMGGGGGGRGGRGGGGGGSSPPAYKKVWVPGNPLSDDFSWVRNLVRQLGGILVGIQKHFDGHYKYTFIINEDYPFILLYYPGTNGTYLRTTSGKVIGQYNLADQQSITQITQDISNNMPNPPIKESCGRTRKITLVSGGMDSALIALYKKAEPVYIRYGQLFEDLELLALNSMNIKPIIIQSEIQQKDNMGTFKSRNLKFFTTLREAYPDEDLIVYFGNNKDDENPKLITDNCQYSIQTVSEAINLMYAGPTFQIRSPLYEAGYNKRAISKVLDESLPKSAFTIWCEESVTLPCGKCHKCQQMIKNGIYETWYNRIITNIPDVLKIASGL